MIARKILCSSKPDIVVKKIDENKWSIAMLTLLKTIEYIFSPGEPVESQTMSGKAEVEISHFCIFIKLSAILH